MAFKKMKISPFKFSEPNEKSPLNNKSNNAPIIPKAIPETLVNVMLFLRIIAEAINTIIGLETMMIPALMGVVLSNPYKNINWLAATPNNPHKPNNKKSFLATFSYEKI